MAPMSHEAHSIAWYAGQRGALTIPDYRRLAKNKNLADLMVQMCKHAHKAMRPTFTKMKRELESAAQLESTRQVESARKKQLENVLEHNRRKRKRDGTMQSCNSSDVHDAESEEEVQSCDGSDGPDEDSADRSIDNMPDSSDASSSTSDQEVDEIGQPDVDDLEANAQVSDADMPPNSNSEDASHARETVDDVNQTTLQGPQTNIKKRRSDDWKFHEKCVKCKKVAEEPYLTNCEHRYCQVCLEQVAQEAIGDGEDGAKCMKCTKVILKSLPFEDFKRERIEEARAYDDIQDLTPRDLYERYRIEIDITRKIMTGTMRRYLYKQLPAIEGAGRGRKVDVDREVGEMLYTFQKLDLWQCKSHLEEYLRNRLVKPAKASIPLTSTMTDYEEIHDALKGIQATTEHSKIHRAYGQIKFYESIRRQAETNPRLYVGESIKPILNVLCNLAKDRAGGVSSREIEERHRSYKTQFHAGKKWLEVSDWFCGDAIVIIFIVAKIGPSYVAYSWTEYQRECLEYVSRHLYGIRKLVKALGYDSLETYCQEGKLSQTCVEEVGKVDIAVAKPED